MTNAEILRAWVAARLEFKPHPPADQVVLDDGTTADVSYDGDRIQLTSTDADGNTAALARLLVTDDPV